MFILLLCLQYLLLSLFDGDTTSCHMTLNRIVSPGATSIIFQLLNLGSYSQVKWRENSVPEFKPSVVSLHF